MPKFKPSFEILHLLGVVYINLKEYEKSIDIFKNLLKKNFLMILFTSTLE